MPERQLLDVELVSANPDNKLLKKHRDTKAPAPWGNLLKVSWMKLRLGRSFRDAVAEKREAFGLLPELTSSGSGGATGRGIWGIPVDGTPFVTHKGNTYIGGENVESQTFYWDQGNDRFLEMGELDGYLPLPKMEGANQGLPPGDEVKWARMPMHNLQALKIGDTTLPITCNYPGLMPALTGIVCAATV